MKDEKIWQLTLAVGVAFQSVAKRYDLPPEAFELFSEVLGKELEERKKKL